MNTLLLAGWIACQSFDLGTTMVALNRPGVVEGNPVLGQNKGRIVGIKISVNAGAFLLHRKAKNKTVFPVVMAGAGCVAGVLNLRALSK